MYLPPHFEGDRAQAADLMRQPPFANFFSVDASGLPFTTHLPLPLEKTDDLPGLKIFTLLGNFAGGNSHCRYFRDRLQAVVNFLGPHAYLSPTVYPDLACVPTWNYVAVHCTVQATQMDDAAAKNSFLKKLIDDHEPTYDKQWQGIENAYSQKMLTVILGFELQVLDLQFKLKLNQHRPEASLAMQAIYENGKDCDQYLGRWMKRIAK
ncbi:MULTISPECIES: FMN-binding negative transcriptional regulator [unclassified Polaromonas]|uniref:FMN-binding negative transcriptional regulator n=1 Tax=unclassified Polaromonas TaxID=2638319 RepID=UPI0018C926F2|nr:MULTISPECIES: FMN-binding negative transcriptional regulator [unclassified Polaromonas]MBG6073634.1 transcriptional regulator [Polaromonas sp. CG_9.7]MBG6115587.1 transcriptional regulator [Polaromonas sp. CG_9.2]MDH6185040.1 transcriptional regulator [Polaromonas sp. CG_23.6]